MKKIIYMLLVAVFLGGVYAQDKAPVADAKAEAAAEAEAKLKQAEAEKEERVHEEIFGIKVIDSNTAIMKETAKFSDGSLIGYATLCAGSDLMIALTFKGEFDMVNAIKVAEICIAKHYASTACKHATYRVYIFNEKAAYVAGAVFQLRDCYDLIKKHKESKAEKGATPAENGTVFLSDTGVSDHRTKKKAKK
jgi:hypothetical protein